MSSLPDFSPRADFRWQRITFLRLAAYCLPLLDAGTDLVTALDMAQQMLPEDRRHSMSSLARLIYRPQWKEALHEVRSMTEIRRATLINGLLAGESQTADLSDAELDAQVNGNAEPDNVFELPSRAQWTDNEWKRIWRRYIHLRRDQGDTRSLADLIDHCQRTELTPDRWRARGGLRSASYFPPEKGSSLLGNLNRAEELPDDLLADWPWDPAASPDNPVKPQAKAPTPPAPTGLPGPKARRVPNRAPGPGALAEALKTALVDEPELPPPPLPAPSPPPEPPPERVRTAQELPPEPARYHPSPAPASRAPRPPVAAFGDAFGQAMVEMLDANQEHILASLEQRVRAIGRELVHDAVQYALKEIAALVPRMVSAILDEQLGGHVPTPQETGQPPEVQSDEHADAHEMVNPDEIIKLDVVGLLQAQCAEVKKHLGLYGTGVRYIDASQASRWTPRSIVVVNYKFVDRTVERTLRNTDAKVIKVHGGTTAVLNAIRNLYELEGVALPQ